MANLEDVAEHAERVAEEVDFAAFLRQRARATQESPTVEPPPLPVLSGRVPPGWKDALSEPR